MKLTISGSPHVHGANSTQKIMYGVVLAMVPALLVSVYYFGLAAVRVTAVAVAACVAIEWLIQKYLMKVTPTLSDGSAVVTGILLAFNLPSNLPSWIIIIGAIAAIGIGKMSFGGLGKNPFNPALVGRVFLLISFPAQMTSWPVISGVDGVTGATALGIIKEGLKNGEVMSDLMAQVPGYAQALLGQMGGSMGEVSALALILGALYMLIKKIITWEIPTAFLGSVLIFTGILWMVDPNQYIHPLYHLVTGGMMLGTFYMATDMVSTPMTRKAQLVFGMGCGILTVVIRVWGAYPEGVSFAILIMNAVAPLLNKAFKPKRFGAPTAS
ncbi:MAG: RnfABCDGE type electron transport complex subunit D [Desulfobacterales bacterium]|nr:RnfABCDGE type electron transport complex subunit D [Desulfobacterales bacterium]